MKWPFFGRREAAKPSARTSSTPAGAYPWSDRAPIRGNLAIGGLRENILNWASTGQGVHVETLAIAIGALTGFAGQNAALNLAAEATRVNGHSGPDDLVLVQTKSGETFLYGELLNRPLILQGGGSPLTLWNLIAGAAIGLGVPQANLPDFGALASHVAETLGTPQFEQVDTSPNLDPHLTPRQALAKMWAATEGIMRQPLPSPSIVEPQLEETDWPIICSLVAAQILPLAKDALAPEVTARVIVNAAIIASKIPPDAISPGRWKIEPVEGGLAVTRV